jgi:hypothetical protein
LTHFEVYADRTTVHFDSGRCELVCEAYEFSLPVQLKSKVILPEGNCIGTFEFVVIRNHDLAEPQEFHERLFVLDHDGTVDSIVSAAEVAVEVVLQVFPEQRVSEVDLVLLDVDSEVGQLEILPFRARKLLVVGVRLEGKAENMTVRLSFQFQQHFHLLQNAVGFLQSRQSKFDPEEIILQDCLCCLVLLQFAFQSPLTLVPPHFYLGETDLSNHLQLVPVDPPHDLWLRAYYLWIVGMHPHLLAQVIHVYSFVIPESVGVEVNADATNSPFVISILQHRVSLCPTYSQLGCSVGVPRLKALLQECRKASFPRICVFKLGHEWRAHETTSKRSQSFLEVETNPPSFFEIPMFFHLPVLQDLSFTSI